MDARLTLLHADSFDFELPEPAALITLPFDSFGHLLIRDDQPAGLRHIRTQLRPGGRFVFDHVVFDEEYAGTRTSGCRRARHLHIVGTIRYTRPGSPRGGRHVECLVRLERPHRQ